MHFYFKKQQNLSRFRIFYSCRHNVFGICESASAHDKQRLFLITIQTGWGLTVTSAAQTTRATSVMTTMAALSLQQSRLCSGVWRSSVTACTRPGSATPTLTPTMCTSPRWRRTPSTGDRQRTQSFPHPPSFSLRLCSLQLRQGR